MLPVLFAVYLNHRDPYGMMSMTDIEEAFVAIERAQKPHQNDCPFKDLCQQNKKKVVLERTCILRLLQTIGNWAPALYTFYFKLISKGIFS